MESLRRVLTAVHPPLYHHTCKFSEEVKFHSVHSMHLSSYNYRNMVAQRRLWLLSPETRKDFSENRLAIQGDQAPKQLTLAYLSKVISDSQ